MSTIVEDDFSPLFVGDRLIPFAPSFRYKDGITAFDLTGATISMKMENEAGATKTCSGTWVTDDAPNGVAHYPWQSGDVDTPGVWTLYVTVTIGGKPAHAQTKVVEILVAP